MVDLKQAVEAAKGEVRSIKMEGTTQPITDASANFVAGKKEAGSPIDSGLKNPLADCLS
jgi:hypothetical protein